MSLHIMRRRFLTGYILALGLIAVTTLFAHWYTVSIIANEDRAAEVVNTSGKQRMLLQRSYALVETLHRDNVDNYARQALEQTIGELRSDKDYLIEYASTSLSSDEIRDELLSLYVGPHESVVTMLNEFTNLALQANDRPLTVEERQDIQDMALGPLFHGLNRAVALFQADAEHGLQRIKDVQAYHALAIFLVLGAEALLIFWPLLSKAINAIRAEQQAQRTAQEALDLHAEAFAGSGRFLTLMREYFLRPLGDAIIKLESAKDMDDEILSRQINQTLADLREVDGRGRALSRAYRENQEGEGGFDDPWKVQQEPT